MYDLRKLANWTFSAYLHHFHFLIHPLLLHLLFVCLDNGRLYRLMKFVEKLICIFAVRPTGREDFSRTWVLFSVRLSLTLNTCIPSFKAHLLCYFFQQEEMSPYSLLTVRIIKLTNAHQADFCKYQIFLLMLHNSQIIVPAPACASCCTNAELRSHTS